MTRLSNIRRRYPALALLGGGAVLALLSFWALEMTRRSGEDIPAEKARSEPDYYIENFSYVKVTTSGTAEYVIKGKRLVHHPADDSSTIELPFVKSYSAEHPPMTLHARRAKTNADHSELHLYEQVRMDRPEARGTDNLSVESEYMLVLPNTDQVKSDQRVVIKLGDSTLIGTGLLADNAKHQMTLLNKVSAAYPPPLRP
jgi:lipopolysaccharide export system protein LptC